MSLSLILSQSVIVCVIYGMTEKAWWTDEWNNLPHSSLPCFGEMQKNSRTRWFRCGQAISWVNSWVGVCLRKNEHKPHQARGSLRISTSMYTSRRTHNADHPLRRLQPADVTGLRQSLTSGWPRSKGLGWGLAWADHVDHCCLKLAESHVNAGCSQKGVPTPPFLLFFFWGGGGRFGPKMGWAKVEQLPGRCWSKSQCAGQFCRCVKTMLVYV